MNNNNGMTFSPLHHFLHIEKVLLQDLKTKGGIVLPDNISENAVVFRVLAAGPGFFDVVASKRVPMSVRPGDYVLINAREVVDASYSGQTCYICPDTAIYGTVTFQAAPDASPDASPDVVE